MKLIKIALCALMMSICCVMQAQTEIKADKNQRHNVVKIISKNYRDWQNCNVNGKIKVSGLMVSPSLKIYMEKEKSISVSVRVPFVGEVARIDANCDSVLLVNKMSKVYTQTSLAEFGADCSVIGQIQSLLLGRPIVAGYGDISEKTEDLVDIYAADGGGYTVVPADSIQPKGFAYGYLLSKSGLIENVMISLGTAQEADADNALTVSYDYTTSGGMTAYCELQKKGGKKVSFKLDLEKPNYTATSPKPFKIGAGYKKVGINEFMKSF